MQGKIVNLRELLIYKILEYTGVGSKAYFYVDRLAPEGVYIATQDAAFTKNPQKHKEFKVYEDIQQQIRAQQPDYGYLTLETTLSLWEILVLVEVLRLTDALTNNGNFGRMTRTIAEQENSYYEKWKLIDFDIRRGQYLQPTIYNDLINGVNREDYGGKPEFQQLFFTSSIEERMSSLGYALYKLSQDQDSLSGGRRLSFENAVNAATSNIQQFIDENRVWLNLEPSEIQTLTVYPREIKQNFACLIDGNSMYKGPRSFGI